MNQTEFNYLTTHVFAIINHSFTIQCGEFASAMARDPENDFTAEEFDLEKHIRDFDFQEILQSGYRDLDALHDQFVAAREQANLGNIESILKKAPERLPPLTQKMNGNELRQWIEYNLTEENDSTLHEINRMLMPLYNSEADDVFDLIREAIAFDELDELKNAEGEIQPKHIRLEDLITAATIESFNTLEWLIKHSELRDSEMLELLENNINDPGTFKRIYDMLSPNPTQQTLIRKRFEELGESDYLTTLSQS